MARAPRVSRKRPSRARVAWTSVSRPQARRALRALRERVRRALA